MDLRDIQITEYADLFNGGLEAAAEHLAKKAKIIREQGHGAPSVTADTMARIFESEAAEILALRRVS